MPKPEDFEFDFLKETWQNQNISEGYNQDEIEVMLNKKSRNYIKYILWISFAEFIIFGFINFIAFFSNDYHTDFTTILNKLHVKNQSDVICSLDKIYNWMKIASLLITGVFLFIFYKKYKKITVEANLKKFIIHIINFKKAVNLFIFTNIFLLLLFIGTFTVFLISIIHKQNIEVDHPTFISLLTGVILSLLISIIITLSYYKLVYGIILGRLTKNLKQLEKIDSEK